MSRKACSLSERSGLDLKMAYLLKFSFTCVKRAVSSVLFSFLNRSQWEMWHINSVLRKAHEENILKTPTPKLFIGLIYFQSKFQWHVGETWNNASVIYLKNTWEKFENYKLMGGKNRYPYIIKLQWLKHHCTINISW